MGGGRSRVHGAAGVGGVPGRAGRPDGAFAGRVRLEPGDDLAAVAINLVVFGVSGPFSAALVERIGLRRVVTVALALIAASAGLTVFVKHPWQLYLLWGIVTGAATGAVAPVLAAMIATRWFHARRGLVVGLLTAANSTGQLIFLPLMSHVEMAGWRWVMLVPGGAALVALPVAGLLMRDRPADLGIPPYGGTEIEPPRAGADASNALKILFEAAPHRHVLGAGRELLRLRRDDRGPDRRALHPRRPRPRDARDAGGLDARADGHPRHRGHDRVGLADRPHGPAPAAVLVLRPARRLARPALQRADDAELHAGPVRRVLRPGLDRHRAADRRAHRAALRAGEVERRVRVGVHVPPDRRRGRGLGRGLRARLAGRLSAGLRRLRHPLRDRRGDRPADPARARRPAPLPVTAPATP